MSVHETGKSRLSFSESIKKAGHFLRLTLHFAQGFDSGQASPALQSVNIIFAT